MQPVFSCPQHPEKFFLRIQTFFDNALDKQKNRSIIIIVERESAKRYAPLAQLVEHLTLNQGVQG